jgi:shikimate dehydrogenase
MPEVFRSEAGGTAVKDYRFGLIGWPLTYSLSPIIHNAALRVTGLEGDYRCFPVPPLPEGVNVLAGLVARMRGGELLGLNVTLPHKQTILVEVDALTSDAEAIGAVNTIFLEGDHLVGDNTDMAGFLVDLEATLSPRMGHALVLGAGGAARAVVFALNKAGWEVRVAARRYDQADNLAQTLMRPGRKPISPIQLRLDSLGEDEQDITLIVNATSVGMAPDVDETPWPEGTMLPEGAAVYDLVYYPRETRLVRDAKAKGLAATGGLGMLVEQAALAFERWTGRAAPRVEMHQAAMQASRLGKQVGGS